MEAQTTGSQLIDTIPHTTARCGKDLILATKPYAKEDRKKSWKYLLSTLFLLLCAWMGTFVMPYLILKLTFSLLTALLMVRMFVIYHDFLHHTILHRSPLANRSEEHTSELQSRGLISYA